MFVDLNPFFDKRNKLNNILSISAHFLTMWGMKIIFYLHFVRKLKIDLNLFFDDVRNENNCLSSLQEKFFKSISTRKKLE